MVNSLVLENKKLSLASKGLSAYLASKGIRKLKNLTFDIYKDIKMEIKENDETVAKLINELIKNKAL